ncbi:MAG: efflux RND transporter periplasmic adaptor subunit, partial [Alphaproteobacteria bacterium]|nr:efflux RND transporter periplasmic adaptor subunit [Alphaproteobacteria bacterium]
MHDSAATALAATLARARRDRRRRIGWLLVLCASGAAGVYAWLSSHARTADEPRIEYVGAPVMRGPLVVKVTATGTLEPLTQVDVGSELSGMVED